jgi:hypothetical protein
VETQAPRGVRAARLVLRLVRRVPIVLVPGRNQKRDHKLPLRVHLGEDAHFDEPGGMGGLLDLGDQSADAEVFA